MREHPAALSVYWIYVSRTNNEGVAWPSGRGLETDTGWEIKTCLKAREWLVQCEALETVKDYIRPEWRKLPAKERAQKVNFDKAEYYRPTGYIIVNGTRHPMLYFGAQEDSDIEEEITDVPPQPTSDGNPHGFTTDVGSGTTELDSSNTQLDSIVPESSDDDSVGAIAKTTSSEQETSAVGDIPSPPYSGTPPMSPDLTEVLRRLHKRHRLFLQAVSQGGVVKKNHTTRRELEEQGLILVTDRKVWQQQLTTVGALVVDLIAQEPPKPKRTRKPNPLFDAVREHIFGIGDDCEDGLIGAIAAWLGQKSDGMRRGRSRVVVGYISGPALPEHVKKFADDWKRDNPETNLPLDFEKFVRHWRAWAKPKTPTRAGAAYKRVTSTATEARPELSETERQERIRMVDEARRLYFGGVSA